MCLIVDANLAASIFTNEPDPEFLPVATALRQRTARTVVGGSKLREEYRRIEKIRRYLIKLDQKGSVRQIADEDVDICEKAIIKNKRCVSDDEHIIALAQVSNTRLLCSHDKDLHKDFTDPLLLKPRGSVYQSSQHLHLISKYCSHKSSKR